MSLVTRTVARAQRFNTQRYYLSTIFARQIERQKARKPFFLDIQMTEFDNVVKVNLKAAMSLQRMLNILLKCILLSTSGPISRATSVYLSAGLLTLVTQPTTGTT